VTSLPVRAFHGAVTLLLLYPSLVFALAAHRNLPCTDCHLTAPEPGEIQVLLDTVDSLCRSCHRIRVQNSHPTDFFPTRDLPEAFPLDYDSRLTCATCHDFHKSLSASGTYLLRGDLKGTEFCRSCHGPDQPLTGLRPQTVLEHLRGAFVAHGKSYTLPGSEEFDVDEVSLYCLSCHDGSMGPQARYCLPDRGEECTSHGIGMDFQRRAVMNPGLRSIESVSPLISLYQGRVGCASCHSLYFKEAALLTVERAQGYLCQQCHPK